MAIARWRLRRLLAIEAHLFEVELARCQDQIDDQFEGMGHEDSLAWVFQRMGDRGNSLSLLIRYEGSLNRSYDKALKVLLTLQSGRRLKIRNEPNRAPDQPREIAVNPERPADTPSSEAPDRNQADDTLRDLTDSSDKGSIRELQHDDPRFVPSLVHATFPASRSPAGRTACGGPT
jgi:hypothetical protein